MPEWYEIPVFYFSNPAAIYGPDDEIPYPEGSEALDYELEVAAVIGAEGRIGGFTVMNDWSARDLQRREMKVGLGPAKGKDFATSLGPVLVTPDELGDLSLEMVARVNGEERSRGNLGDIYHSWESILAQASRNTELRPGDVLGSGTVGTGCILEHGDERWLQPGDEVELEVEGIGVLRNRVGPKRCIVTVSVWHLDRPRLNRHDTAMRVAVIGAGVMGLATGWALKRRGHEPVVYEQFEVGNPHGSSHGRSRIFRLAYAEDHYVRLAQESLGLWRELEAETGETVLELHGLVEIVRTLEESTAHTLERCGVAWERLDPEEAERRFPIRVPEGSFVVTQHEAGIARADKALAAFRRELDVREGERVRPDELDADVVVVTAGSWVNELLDEPLPVKTTRETFCYFRPDAGGRPVPSVVSFQPDRHTHDMYSLYDPSLRAQGRCAPRRAGGRPERAGRA